MSKSKAREYVVVDLETTGLDPDQEAIIEIGAVKLRRGLVVDEFSTFVMTNKPITAQITEITGIHAEMLEGQPTAIQAVGALRDFVGEAEIVAHNASFDRAFVLPYWPETGEWLDSIVLAQIAYPTASSYSLANLCDELGIENEQAHRALSDARATAELFQRSRKRLAALPPKAQEDLLLLVGEEKGPLDDLLRQECASTGASAADMIVPQPTFKPARPQDESYQIPLSAIANYLGEEGQYQQRLEGFEYRPQQQELAERVAASLNEQRFLLAEAGTGTGKSLAYLLPAALFALNTGVRVAISTHTINLQEQLLQKDIPLLEKLLDQPVQAVVLKGRSNYLCRRMYRGQLRNPSENLRFFLMRLTSWLAQTQSGDVSELNLTHHDKWRWQRLCAASENCDVSCPYFKSGCFVSKARREADKADIFILNHALLIANAQMDTSFLPPLPYLIIDEAHHLERAAEDQLTEQVDFYQLLRLLGRLKRRERGRVGGLLEALRKQVEPLLLTETARGALQERLTQLEEEIESAVKQAEQLFGHLQLAYAAAAAKEGYYPARLRLLAKHREASDWLSVDQLGQNLANAVVSLMQHLLRFADLVQGQALENGLELDGREELLSVASLLGGQGMSIHNWLTPPATEGREDYVCWLEFPGKDKYPSLNLAPVELGELLKSCLFDQTQAMVLTSATMTTSGTFTYLKKRLGLDLLENAPQELTLQSPFFYEDQALFCVCDSLPDWSKTGELACQEAVAGALTQLVAASKGRALVLFTSHSQLRAVYELIKDPLREQGIEVLAHGISGDPARLLRRLNREQNICVLGANSFWEGVDVIGSALSLVVVVRLPFWPPNTPTIAARMERIDAEGGSSFFEYSLPQSIIRFKQGFGRLIRSTEDTGVFCVLDRRIFEKKYGRNFIRSLPEMKLVQGNLSELTKQIEDWLVSD